MYGALDVAKYFLSKVDEDAGDLISNLKLQKLLYYAQGLHLAVRGEPLFPEKIKAWAHGPVVEEVHEAFRSFGNGGIPPTARPVFDESTVEILDEVYSVYGQFSAWKLRNMTHEEAPWKSTPSRGVIALEQLAEYFRTQVV